MSGNGRLVATVTAGAFANVTKRVALGRSVRFAVGAWVRSEWLKDVGGRCDGMAPSASVCKPYAASVEVKSGWLRFRAGSSLVLGRSQGRQLGGKLDVGPAVSSGSLSPVPDRSCAGVKGTLTRTQTCMSGHPVSQCPRGHAGRGPPWCEFGQAGEPAVRCRLGPSYSPTDRANPGHSA